MKCNVARLHAEYKAAGLQITGCDETGRVCWADGTWRPGDPTPDEQRRKAAAVYAAHDPNPTYAELRASEYVQRGLSTEALAVALWERIVEGRPETSDAIQKQREVVKAAYPKEI